MAAENKTLLLKITDIKGNSYFKAQNQFSINNELLDNVICVTVSLENIILIPSGLEDRKFIPGNLKLNKNRRQAFQLNKFTQAICCY